MSKTCIVCQKAFEIGGETFPLTDEEKKAIGAEAPDEIHYCSACLKVMTDQEAGAQLLKGFYEMGLREIGVAPINARKMAQKFYEKLKGKEKLH